MRRDDESGRKRVEEALARLWEAMPTPAEEDLGSLAEAAWNRTREAPGQFRRRRRLGARAAIAAAAVSLLVGSGLGFGLGSSLTPSGSASAIVGFGFLPAQGWNVVQTGTVDATGVARAVAANVRLDPRDDLRGEPVETIRRLPPNGVLISATFRPRGDAGVDATFPARQPPLRLGDAKVLTPGQLELRAGVRGHNVLLTIHFGKTEPAQRARAAAQRQLDRLIVAAERVTIFARPTILSSLSPWTTLFGSIENGREDELVTLQAKDCGSDFFRVVGGATTRGGGTWTTQYAPGINTLLRAVWDGTSSPQVGIKQRVGVYLWQRGPSLFRIGAGSPPRGGMVGGQQTAFWGKRVRFQRLDRRLGRWLTVKTVRIDQRQRTGTEFRATLPRGTLVRAVMPLSEARPCFLGGVSFTLRVT